MKILITNLYTCNYDLIPYIIHSNCIPVILECTSKVWIYDINVLLIDYK